MKIIPGYRDSNGHWRQPRSECCHAPVVRWSETERRYFVLAGWDMADNPGPYRCQKCNQELER